MIDGTGITMLSTIEFEICETGLPGIPIMLELHQQESLRFLHRFPLYEPINHDTLMGTSISRSDSVDSASMALISKTKEAGAGMQPESFINHPRFASGDIFTASCLGALMATAYYTPGIIELLDAMLLGSSSEQTSFPWQVTVPEECIGKTYADVVQLFLAEKWAASCLGLYRRCFPDTGSSACYVVTNPVPTTVLRPDDLAIVFGTADFAQKCFDEGLIVGAIGAPRSTDVEELPTLSPEGSARGDPLEENARPDPAPSSDQLEATASLDLVLLRDQANCGARAGAPTALDPFNCDGGIAPESPMPALPHVAQLQQELDQLRQLYADSLRRETGQDEELKSLREQIKLAGSSGQTRELSRQPDSEPSRQS